MPHGAEGTSSVDQQATWGKIQSGDATPAQTEAFAKEILTLSSRRASTFNAQYKSVMGTNDPAMITPDAQAASIKLLGNDLKTNPLLQFGSGGTYGKPAAKAAVAPAGATNEVYKSATDKTVIGHMVDGKYVALGK